MISAKFGTQCSSLLINCTGFRYFDRLSNVMTQTQGAKQLHPPGGGQEQGLIVFFYLSMAWVFVHKAS